ncbi:HemK2/MTQ2 family protein methyltransferase [Streptomyces indicus]|uniref:Release factor glutamine methyltransferase n=1 Tax=Streptomyces indicus TaxID=417292 RepID=A0A1G9JI93_9ACTN|nr:HemK2/MTQ2 family protein methyltransferase [Streptomyces indicus]SDL36956.1 release factor glutamine methyltransferase [Streptomyces indicus]
MSPLSLPGVYAPQADTVLLAEALAREPLCPGARALDLGTGTGALALAAARRGAQVTAVDVSWPAVLTARLNARRARLPVRVLHGDLLDPVAGQTFDLILSNPPYVPAPSARPPRRGAARAWDAGSDGRLVLDRICRRAPALLAPGGRLLLVHSALSDPEATLTQLRTAGLRAAVTEHRYIPFGPVLRARQTWLRATGLLRNAADKEELVIIRAERPH